MQLESKFVASSGSIFTFMQKKNCTVSVEDCSKIFFSYNPVHNIKSRNRDWQGKKPIKEKHHLYLSCALLNVYLNYFVKNQSIYSLKYFQNISRSTLH